MTEHFGSILRKWRKFGRYSQLQLALKANVSTRHISFLETARAQPSRSMVLQLGRCLSRTKQDINHAMMVAGFTAIYPQLPAKHIDLAPLNTGLETLLDNHMPFPALIVDRYWNLVNANGAAVGMLGGLGMTHTNLILAMIEDGGKHIINWHETMVLLLERLRSEMLVIGVDDQLLALETQLAECLGIDGEAAVDMSGQTILSVQLALADQEISMFSILGEFGAIQDVRASELKVELFFPMDEKSSTYFTKRFG